MFKIMFVCHGNICRSPMAEYIMKDILSKNNINNVEVISRATSTEEIGNDLYYATKDILNVHHIPYGRHYAKQLSKKEFNEYDMIICMDDYNVRNLKYLVGTVNEKVFKLMNFCNQDKDISDPWYTRKFENCYNEIFEGCRGLLKYLQKKGIIFQE